MTSIKDKMNHAATVTKWKVDQQVRIVRGQNSLHDLENQVRAQKATLAEATLALYAQHPLAEGQLNTLCEQISQTHAQIQNTMQAIEAIKQELPPADPALYSAAYPTAMNTSMQQPVYTSEIPLSGLICPECGMALVGRFCQIHGKEGIPANP
jgi:hypothetical protein